MLRNLLLAGLLLALFVGLGAAFYRTRYGDRVQQYARFGEKLEDYAGDWQCKSPPVDVRVQVEPPATLRLKGWPVGQELVFERTADLRTFVERAGSRKLQLRGHLLCLSEGEQVVTLELRQP